MLVSMRMQTGVSKLVLHSDKILSTTGLGLHQLRGRSQERWKIKSKLLLEVECSSPSF